LNVFVTSHGTARLIRTCINHHISFPNQPAMSTQNNGSNERIFASYSSRKEGENKAYTSLLEFNGRLVFLSNSLLQIIPHCFAAHTNTFIRLLWLHLLGQ
jgi:hypothetical protein